MLAISCQQRELDMNELLKKPFYQLIRNIIVTSSFEGQVTHVIRYVIMIKSSCRTVALREKIVDRPESDKLIRASVANKSELEIYLYFPQIYKHVENFSS